MAQQHGIIVLFDVERALQTRSLDGNTYWFDNMKFLGSEGVGTENLTTIVPGTYFSDGSQATEQVLNWLPSALGAVPPTVPRNYLAERAWQTDREALQAGDGQKGRRAKRAGGRALAPSKLLDVTGQAVDDDALGTHNPPAPVITDITGPAVEENIIYPAQYGSPDMVYDGWYWAATVDTSRPGLYPYTMHVQLHELGEEDGELVWRPVDFTCGSALKITNDPVRNAFTGAGLGTLPLPLVPAPAPA